MPPRPRSRPDRAGSRPHRLLLAALVTTLLLAPAADVQAAKWRGRLPEAVTPLAQSVRLELDPHTTTYRGSVEITLDVPKSTENFLLHSEGLSLEAVRLVQGERKLAATAKPMTDDVVRIQAEEKLPAGRWDLHVEFTGSLDDSPVGLYRVEYEGDAYAFTQFEADEAREAFPCFDEPHWKIPFRMTLVVPEHDLAVANTLPESETVADGRRTVVFAPTQRLPTYLIAIAVGPFEVVDIPGLGIPARVVVAQGKAPLAGMARDATGPILASLEAWFERPYPFEKLDLIAVPQFWPGAMENAGAITFRDSALLLDPAVASLDERLGMEGILAHELAHQWFGNLVTLAWWNDLWLNETFADWLADRTIDGLHPELALPLKNLMDTQNQFARDARPTSRPIRKDADGTEELLQGVGLAYAKGKLVLGMFERWVGRDVFRRSILAYIEAHAGGSATSHDLWSALDEESGRPVSRVLAGFLDQPGFPRISVTLSGNRVRLAQQRFVSGGSDVPDLSWRVPLVLRWFDGGQIREREVLLEGASLDVELAADGPIRWVYPNAAAKGYYRWLLSKDARRALLEDLARLEPSERVEVIANVGALVDAGEVSAVELLELLDRSAADPHPRVVGAAITGLQRIRDTLADGSPDPEYSAWVRAAFSPALARFGASPQDGEDACVTAVRPALLTALGDHGRDPDVLSDASRRARSYLDSPSSVHSSVVPAILLLAARTGDASFFDVCRQRFEQAKTPRERSRFLNCLGAFRDSGLRDRALAYVLEGPLRAQEIATIPNAIAAQDPAGGERAFEWLLENFDSYRERVPPPNRPAITTLAGGCSAARFERAREFFADADRQDAGTLVRLAQVGDQVAECERLRARDAAGMMAWLADRPAPEATGRY